jgi:hypothetical protein
MDTQSDEGTGVKVAVPAPSAPTVRTAAHGAPLARRWCPAGLPCRLRTSGAGRPACAGQPPVMPEAVPRHLEHRDMGGHTVVTGQPEQADRSFLFLLGSTRADGNTETPAQHAARGLPPGAGQQWLRLSELPLPEYSDTRHQAGRPEAREPSGNERLLLVHHPARHRPGHRLAAVLVQRVSRHQAFVARARRSRSRVSTGAAITSPAPRYAGCRGLAIRRTSDGGRNAGLHRLRAMTEVGCCCGRLSRLGARVRTRRYRVLTCDTHRLADGPYLVSQRPLRTLEGAVRAALAGGHGAVRQLTGKRCRQWPPVSPGPEAIQATRSRKQ